MTLLSILTALAGGVLIGLAAALLLFFNKRTAGISGIAAGILLPWHPQESVWRWWFLAGLLVSAPLWTVFGGEVHILVETPLAILAGAGLLVGYGTRLGGGCTSGHGICGIARLSVRSIVATLTFMLTAGITVYLVRHLQ